MHLRSGKKRNKSIINENRLLQINKALHIKTIFLASFCVVILNDRILKGWTTDGTNQACTTDVNECNSNRPVCSKDPAVPCINVPGSFYCGACPTGTQNSWCVTLFLTNIILGYTGNGFYCVDINECEINNGGCSLYPRVDCINTQVIPYCLSSIYGH